MNIQDKIGVLKDDGQYRDNLYQRVRERTEDIRQSASQYFSAATTVKDGELVFVPLEEVEQERVSMFEHALSAGAEIRGYLAKLPASEAIGYYQKLLEAEKEMVSAYLL